MADNNADAAGAAHDATVSTDPTDAPNLGCAVEIDDWVLQADSPEALTETIDRKLAQAHQARDAADVAIKRWTAAAKKAAK